MLTILKDHARRLLRLVRRPAPRPDLPFWSRGMARQADASLREVRPYTMTGPERVHALCQSVAYLESAGVPGDVVECGVWKGGSMMAAALALLSLGTTRRRLFLFDTFAGMPEPSALDRDLHGRPAAELLAGRGPECDLVRAVCPLPAVRAALARTGYPADQLVFVPGLVEDTLPDAAPETIALLRLDTDWFDSTLHELRHLWPRLAPGGALILDDYGHWQGARRAADEFFTESALDVHLHALDYPGRLVVKKHPIDAPRPFAATAPRAKG
jgi:hypothetical protein